MLMHENFSCKRRWCVVCGKKFLSYGKKEKLCSKCWENSHIQRRKRIKKHL